MLSFIPIPSSINACRVLLFGLITPLAGQVTMTGPKVVAPNLHDGGLRPVVGVQEHALFRPTHNTGKEAGPLDGHGVIHQLFHHHPFITFWKNRFWVYHIGFDVDDATKTGYLHWSDDGRTWNDVDRTVLFPAPLATHQRLAFFIAANGRLLATTWHSRNGEAGRGGVGSRLVREIRGPGNFGPTLVLRHNHKGPAAGISFASYESSDDPEFKAACSELLADRLQMQQMWEEEINYNPDSPYEIQPKPGDKAFEGKAFSWYRLDHAEGRIVANWKGGTFGISRGGSWKKDEITLDLELNRFGEHRSAKMWGEPKSDGGYAMFYSMSTLVAADPQPTYLDSRTPFVVATGEDGLNFTDGPYAISGDGGPQLFRNGKADNKTTGGSYVRGITWIANREKKPRFNENLWVTYSNNKEFICVTEVPRTITPSVRDHVNESFADWKPGGRVGDWNIRNSAWAPVRLVAGDSGTVLRLGDKDPYDYAKAFRVFPESKQVTVSARISPKQNKGGELHVEMVDASGKRPVRLRFSTASGIERQDAAGNWHRMGDYQAGRAVGLTLTVDAAAGLWSGYLDGRALGEALPVAEAAASVERIEFRTGAWRLDDFRTNNYGGRTPGSRQTDLEGAHDPVQLAEFDLLGLGTAKGILKPVAHRSRIPATGIRIMCLGDSITVGAGTNDGGYRKRLHELLVKAGISHDFVGSQTAGSGNMTDPEHEGYGGKNTSEISRRASPHFSKVAAHLYLVHVGTNDVSEIRDMDGRLRHLLDQIYSATPEATVILAKIINRSDGGRLTELDSIRAGIEPVVNDYRRRQRSIQWVDQNHLGPRDFPPGDLFHPNDSGYRKMAAVWFKGILSAYGSTTVPRME